MSEPVAPPYEGETLGVLVVPITAERVRDYAQASGDYNPIHIDPAFAATTEFGGTIAHGMLLIAYLTRLLSARFGRAWAATGVLEARFRAPARIGTTITAQGTVQAITDDVSGRRVECRLSCTGAGDQALVTAVAYVTLPHPG